MDSREEAIQAAINDYRVGKYRSQRAAANAYAIPYATFHGRLNRATTSATHHQHQQRLSPRQEKFLVEWILDDDARGYPPTILRVREMADRVLSMDGDVNPIGQAWVSRFIQNNPRIAPIIGRKIESLRADVAPPHLTSTFLGLFERTRILDNIRLQDIYDMDETGIYVYVQTPENLKTLHARNKTCVATPDMTRTFLNVFERTQILLNIRLQDIYDMYEVDVYVGDVLYKRGADLPQDLIRIPDRPLVHSMDQSTNNQQRSSEADIGLALPAIE